MASKIAGPLGMTVEQGAAGIHAIVNENMAAATRMYIAEKGRDPRRYTMIAFGGAGPVHAYGLAKLLKLRRLICPLGAGVMSALGFLVAAPAVDMVRSFVTRLDVADWDEVNRFFEDMKMAAIARLVEAGARPDETGYAPCPVYNRYALKSGDSFRGPAVVEERESTTVIGPDSTVTVDSFLTIVIDIG